MQHHILADHRSRESGQGLVEYALILALVAVVMIAVLMLISPPLRQSYCVVIAAVRQTTVASVCP